MFQMLEQYELPEGPLSTTRMQLSVEVKEESDEEAASVQRKNN